MYKNDEFFEFLKKNFQFLKKIKKFLIFFFNF